MANINDILKQQQYLAQRLTYLNGVVNSLLRDDCTRHEHTINHYLRELEDHRQQAHELNLLVQQIVAKSIEKHGWKKM